MFKNEREKELIEDVIKYITDKKSLLNRYKSFLAVYKKSKKALKKTLNESIIHELVDVSSYRAMQETQIKVIMNNLTTERKILDIHPDNRIFKLSDCFMYSIRFIENDLKNLLNENYFKEIKRTKIDNDQVYRNLKIIIKIKKSIIDEHFKFLLSFYKMIPSLLTEERKKRENKNIKKKGE